MATGFGHDGDRLSAFLDDELDDRAAAEVVRHVAACGACAEELEQLRATRAALRSLPRVEAPLSFMVETVVLGPGPDDATHARTAFGLAVGAGLLLLVAAFVLGGTELGSVQPPVDALVVDHVRSVDGGPVVVPVRLERTAGGG